MNDNDIEQRLEKLLGRAPVVPAPEGLRRAVSAERAPLDERTAEGNQPSPAPRPVALWHGRRARTISALAGLAATFVLAAGLLLIVVNRPTAPAVSPDTSGRERIEWRSGLLPETDPSGLMAQLNGRVMYVGEDVWALDEPSGKWDKLTASPPFGTDDIIGIVEDGAGGFVAYGFDQVTVDDGVNSPAALVWRSRDGRTWTRVGLGVGIVRKVVATASGLVAVGFVPKPAVGGCQNPEHAVAWTLRTDGTWAQSMLPGDAAEATDAIVWRGRIVVMGARTCWQSEAGGSPSYPPDLSLVWVSSDGTSWDRVAATGLSSSGDPVVAPYVASNGSTVVSFDNSGFTKRPFVTTDLSNWSAVSLPAQEGANLAVWWVAGAGSGYLAFGDGCALWASDDGQTWRSLSGRPESIPSNFTCPGASVSGNRVAIATGRNGDGSYGYLLGTIIRVETAPSEAPPSASPTASTTASPSATASPTAYALQLANAASWANGTAQALVANGSTFYAFIGTAEGPTVWSSTDGSSWSKLADPAAFTGGALDAKKVEIVAAGVAGNVAGGGLIAVGHGPSADGHTLPGLAWYSADGRTWQTATLDIPSAEFSSLAIRKGTCVAFGDAPYISTDGGATWSRTYATGAGTTPAPSQTPAGDFTADSAGVHKVSAWQGGFIALPIAGGANLVWTSPDGNSWTRRSDWRLPAGAIDISTLRDTGDVLVARATDASGASFQASLWWSADGRSWQSTQIGPDAGLVALPGFGSGNDLLSTDEAPSPGPLMIVAGEPAGGSGAVPIWTSSDGRSWQKVAQSGMPVEPGSQYQIALMGSRVVILGGVDGASAWSGDLAAQ